MRSAKRSTSVSGTSLAVRSSRTASGIVTPVPLAGSFVASRRDDPVGAQTLGEPRRVQILPVGSGGRGVEVDPALAEQAAQNNAAVGLSPRIVEGDGCQGWPEGAPYQRIYWELSGRRDTERDAVRPVDGNGIRDAGPAARSPGGRDGLEAVGRLRCDGGGDVGRQQQTAGARLCPPGTCGPTMPFASG
ncbi:hypothetical protein JHN53_12745 [Streptomyces sp. MBT58]|uniref:hypothetical protein n=1 Tax=Streptomyces sp. MBT58 TaxID=1488389 RepID=UPI001914122F|nr:hypothetical protein [Streptomyces sp. MBT58]MBK5992496.1 hypothetical protein [Streptomyces sp. MBT58]